MSQPRVAAGLLIRDLHDRVLMVRPTYKDGWDLPGGYVEPNESPTKAVERELTEELSLARSPGRLLVVDWAPRPAEGDRIRRTRRSYLPGPELPESLLTPRYGVVRHPSGCATLQRDHLRLGAVMPYESAGDLPTVIKMEEQLRALRMLTFLRWSQRGEVKRLRDQLRYTVSTVDAFYNILGPRQLAQCAERKGSRAAWISCGCGRQRPGRGCPNGLLAGSGRGRAEPDEGDRPECPSAAVVLDRLEGSTNRGCHDLLTGFALLSPRTDRGGRPRHPRRAHRGAGFMTTEAVVENCGGGTADE
jgi:ADP-ribose pyrophosphatase YjhB (NUDIX family)